MKVLLVNPWAIVNDEYYASGFVSAMNQFVKLDFATNKYYCGVNPSGQIYDIFFKKSQLMKLSKFRTVIRGIEYILAWKKIIKLIRSGGYDVIHFHWLLMYQVDFRFLSMLRKIRNRRFKLVLTAHNVIPHIEGEKSISILTKVYRCFDAILVHGEAIKKEFEYYFPQLADKVHIQFHGEYYEQDTMYNIDENDADYLRVMERAGHAKRRYIVFGGHYYNKGTDRFLRIWKERMADKDSLLIILGKIDVSYTELQEEIKDLPENVLLYEGFIEDNFLNFCIMNSDCICIPYRHASMSGIVYTAASFQKMVICTECGAIAEYLENGEDSIVCENSEKGLMGAISKVEMLPIEQIHEMGKRLSENIHEKFGWATIVDDLYHDVYLT